MKRSIHTQTHTPVRCYFAICACLMARLVFVSFTRSVCVFLFVKNLRALSQCHHSPTWFLRLNFPTTFNLFMEFQNPCFVFSLVKCLLSTHLRYCVYAAKQHIWSDHILILRFIPFIRITISAAAAAASASAAVVSAVSSVSASANGIFTENVENAYAHRASALPCWHVQTTFGAKWALVKWETNQNRKSPFPNDTPSKIEFGSILSLRT